MSLRSPWLLLLGLLALQLGRQLPELEAARADLLTARVAAESATDADRQALSDHAARSLSRLRNARMLVGAGHALLLCGLALAALRPPAEDEAAAGRWLWIALLGWTLLLMFTREPTLAERLR